MKMKMRPKFGKPSMLAGNRMGDLLESDKWSSDGSIDSDRDSGRGTPDWIHDGDRDRDVLLVFGWWHRWSLPSSLVEDGREDTSVVC